MCFRDRRCAKSQGCLDLDTSSDLCRGLENWMVMLLLVPGKKAGVERGIGTSGAQVSSHMSRSLLT